MAINSDTEINLALLQLGKNANRYRLNQSLPPHEIIEWDLEINKDIKDFEIDFVVSES